jgi:hypothetical protein
LAATENVAVPLPFCPAAEVTAMNDALVSGVQAHALVVATPMLIGPPPDATLMDVVDRVYVQLAVGAAGLLFEQPDNSAATRSETMGKARRTPTSPD